MAIWPKGTACGSAHRVTAGAITIGVTPPIADATAINLRRCIQATLTQMTTTDIAALAAVSTISYNLFFSFNLCSRCD